jgi:hypothetical protein
MCVGATVVCSGADGDMGSLLGSGIGIGTGIDTLPLWWSGTAGKGRTTAAGENMGVVLGGG